MLAFPFMLVSAAKKAGIKVPPEGTIDNEDYQKADYVHWHVLCLTQLNRKMQHGEHWDNAVALAAIPEERLKKMTVTDLQDAGVGCGC